MIGVHYIVLYFFAIRYKQIDTIFHISQPDLGNRRGNPLRLPRACCFSHKGLDYRRGKSLAVAPRACCFSHKGFGYRRGKSLAVAPRVCCFSHTVLGNRKGCCPYGYFHFLFVFPLRLGQPQGLPLLTIPLQNLHRSMQLIQLARDCLLLVDEFIISAGFLCYFSQIARSVGWDNVDFLTRFRWNFKR